MTRRNLFHRITVFLPVMLVLVIIIGVPGALAQELTATTTTTVNVRTQANQGGDVLGQVPAGSSLILEGTDAVGNWTLVHTPDGSLRGWVASGYLLLEPGMNTSMLPITREVVSAGAPPPAQQQPQQQPQQQQQQAQPEQQQAQPAANNSSVSNGGGVTAGNLNVRAEPNTTATIRATLNPNTRVIIEGRNNIGDWVVVRTPDGGIRGWVASRFLYLDPDVVLPNLPVISGDILPSDDGTVDHFDPVAAQYNVPVPASASGDIAAIEAALNATPTLYNMASGTARRIFADGLGKGNRRDVFTVVGDSISATQPFMTGFGNGDYNLGGYGYLQDTINFFSQTPAKPGGGNSFLNSSLANGSAFNAAAVLDELWTNPSFCNPTEEAPLLCEYRLSQPSVAIIMLGSVDIQVIDLGTYNNFMNRIIDLTIDRGIIPVLTTFPIGRDYIHWEQGMRFNMVLLEIANNRGIPLINLWKETQSLPGFGVREDRFHLSQGPTFYSFNGEERQYGVTLRNLLTLQALDQLRQNVLQG